METLVDIAKRLGIKPDPTRMNWVNGPEHYKEMLDKYLALTEPLLKELQLKWQGVKGKEPTDARAIWDAVYRVCKKVNRTWDNEQLGKVLLSLKRTAEEGVRIHDQDGEAVREDLDAIFIWHSAHERGKRNRERFQVDVRLDDPHFLDVIKKLDAFIKKHKSRYKIPDLHHVGRTDTLNVYMGEEITPEITAELYEIVKPVLNDSNNDYLNGLQVMNNGKPVKGFKYGPEALNYDYRIGKNIRNILRRDLGKDLGDLVWGFASLNDDNSLGMVSAKIEMLDLWYYLVGKEGQNPFQLGNEFALSPEENIKCGGLGSAYKKVIDIAD